MTRVVSIAAAVVSLALFFCAASSARAEDDDDPEPGGGSSQAQRALKGTWTVTKAVFLGRETKAPPGMTYAFERDKLVRTTPFGKGGNQNYEVKIDARKKPYRITMTPEGGGKAQSGIFKIEKGELFLATGVGKDGKAAEDFSGTNGGVMVMTKDKK